MVFLLWTPYGTEEEKEVRVTEREGAGGSWTADARHFRSSGGLPRERELLREKLIERERIGCTRIEGEVSSCKIFFFIVKFAYPMEASPFVADPRILIIFYFILFLLFSYCIAWY